MWRNLAGIAVLEAVMELAEKMEERETRPVVLETRATLHSEAVPLLQALNILQEGDIMRRCRNP